MSHADVTAGAQATPAPRRRVLLWLMLVAFTGLLCLGALEAVARLVPGPWRSTFFHRFDPTLGTWHLESISGTYSGQDFTTARASTNSFGMRDRERSLAKPAGTYRIAVLGDSFTEALHVNDDETFTRRLEQLLGPNVEVLNFGVAGFGTAQEYLAYREKARAFKPDLVILGFLSANDIRNNSRQLEELSQGGAEQPRPFVARGDDGAFSITPVPARAGAQNPAVLFLKRHLASYRLLWNLRSTLLSRRSSVQPDGVNPATAAENVNLYLARLSAPPDGEPFLEAWEGTEWSISQLAQAAAADGAPLVLVTFPSAAHLKQNPRAALEEEYGGPLPDAFDIDYPERRLESFATQHGMAMLNLVPPLRSYVASGTATVTDLYYEHDGHWTSRGHELVAELLAEFLRQRELVADGG